MRLWLLAWLLFTPTLSAGAAFAQSCEKYDPEVVEVTGTLFTHTAYGPPNYGEDPDIDSLETVPVLRLDDPICVDEAPGDGGASPTERDVKSIQLVYSSPGVKFRRDLLERAADGALEPEEEKTFFVGLHILAAGRDPLSFQPFLRLLR